MATSQIVLQGEDTAKQGELYIAFELGDLARSPHCGLFSLPRCRSRCPCRAFFRTSSTPSTACASELLWITVSANRLRDLANAPETSWPRAHRRPQHDCAVGNGGPTSNGRTGIVIERGRNSSTWTSEISPRIEAGKTRLRSQRNGSHL